ncbi:hypothetical protein CY34DRAFT_486547 [Suillus luteus UH-Slu-Lm8-n1]|uniref:Uncharacterized protein n=1 Tax=Suillus luteus UH-Slu-Lm8-n1 TaxID=930992 RepID=A0A0D0A6T1_9AGAM|nr:hypothetical protein CY34DRAFT_486547 [Suillus luteus UH-Slu-Lm8-n1]
MVYGKVAFRHLLLSSRSRKIIFNGCVDYAIGRAFLSLDPNSPLVLASTKVGSIVERAVPGPQLLIYLASIRQSREARGRTDIAVYGVASNGFQWKFVMITHPGFIKVSAPFSTAFLDDTKIILDCLAFMVAAAALMLPTSGIGEHAAGGQWDIDDPSLHIGRNTESDDGTE